LVGLVLSFALAIGMAQVSDTYRDVPLVLYFQQMYEDFLNNRALVRSAAITRLIRQSEPKVYVDGLLAAPLEYGPAGRMDVRLPGDGVYSLVLFAARRLRADGIPTGWVLAGKAHENLVEFEAGGRRIRIECNRPIVDSDHPVSVMRRQ
jgi:hypothetical protein